mmetsp:Transcript_46544/g.129750  ORF Transcript_46544/g.129750 Transcript_46544/m.129750 type:complete len:207 (+) Transcript_46544:653-1273(+)
MQATCATRACRIGRLAGPRRRRRGVAVAKALVVPLRCSKPRPQAISSRGTHEAGSSSSRSPCSFWSGCAVGAPTAGGRRERPRSGRRNQGTRAPLNSCHVSTLAPWRDACGSSFGSRKAVVRHSPSGLPIPGPEGRPCLCVSLGAVARRSAQRIRRGSAFGSRKTCWPTILRGASGHRLPQRSCIHPGCALMLLRRGADANLSLVG